MGFIIDVVICMLDQDTHVTPIQEHLPAIFQTMDVLMNKCGVTTSPFHSSDLIH
jgi:hypothetical protein